MMLLRWLLAVWHQCWCRVELGGVLHACHAGALHMQRPAATKTTHTRGVVHHASCCGCGWRAQWQQQVRDAHLPRSCGGSSAALLGLADAAAPAAAFLDLLGWAVARLWPVTLLRGRLTPGLLLVVPL
jgi:hypothetical protein